MPDPTAAVQDKIAGLFSPTADKPETEEVQETPEGEVPEGGEGAEAGAQAEAQERVPEGEGTQAQPKEKEVEVEIDGERYLVPEKLSHRLIQHADYSRKTQDFAELRRVTSAERETYAIERHFEEEIKPERREIAFIEAQLDQAKAINWTGMDAQQLMQTRAQLDAMKDRKIDLEAQIGKKRQQFDGRLAALREESLAAGARYIESHIKQFDPAKRRMLYTYGIREGYTQHEMENLADPRLVVTLWKASQWDQLQASKPAVTKRAAAAGPVNKPGAGNRNQQNPNADAQYRKALSSAKDSTEKSHVIQKRLEDKLFGPAR